MPNQVSQETIKELRHAIAALSDYTDKQRTKYARLIVIFIVVSCFVSIGVTTSIVSGCFLSGDRHPPGVCTYIPGYEDSVRNGEELTRQFRELQKVTEENRQKIKELQDGR